MNAKIINISDNTVLFKSELEEDLTKGFLNQDAKNTINGNCFNIKPINN